MIIEKCLYLSTRTRAQDKISSFKPDHSFTRLASNATNPESRDVDRKRSGCEVDKNGSVDHGGIGGGSGGGDSGGGGEGKDKGGGGGINGAGDLTVVGGLFVGEANGGDSGDAGNGLKSVAEDGKQELSRPASAAKTKKLRR